MVDFFVGDSSGDGLDDISIFNEMVKRNENLKAMFLFLGQMMFDRGVLLSNYHYNFTIQRLVFNQWGGIKFNPKKDPKIDMR